MIDDTYTVAPANEGPYYPVVLTDDIVAGPDSSYFGSWGWDTSAQCYVRINIPIFCIPQMFVSIYIHVFSECNGQRTCNGIHCRLKLLLHYICVNQWLFFSIVLFLQRTCGFVWLFQTRRNISVHSNVYQFDYQFSFYIFCFGLSQTHINFSCLLHRQIDKSVTSKDEATDVWGYLNPLIKMGIYFILITNTFRYLVCSDEMLGNIISHDYESFYDVYVFHTCVESDILTNVYVPGLFMTGAMVEMTLMKPGWENGQFRPKLITIFSLWKHWMKTPMDMQS